MLEISFPAAELAFAAIWLSSSASYSSSTCFRWCIFFIMALSGI